jgi:hypothetical protein
MRLACVCASTQIARGHCLSPARGQALAIDSRTGIMLAESIVFGSARARGGLDLLAARVHLSLKFTSIVRLTDPD